jgi:hypothetical protein
MRESSPLRICLLEASAYKDYQRDCFVCTFLLSVSVYNIRKPKAVKSIKKPKQYLCHCFAQHYKQHMKHGVSWCFPAHVFVFVVLLRLSRNFMKNIHRFLHQNIFTGGFWDFFLFLKYDIQHCFICRSSDSIVSEDAEIEPKKLRLRHCCQTL